MNTFENIISQTMSEVGRPDFGPLSLADSNHGLGIIRTDKANISTFVSKKFSIDQTDNPENVKITIVGNSGRYILDGNVAWADLLTKWGNLGFSVDYILAEPNERVTSSLKQAFGSSGRLRILVPSERLRADDEASRIMKDWNEYHFMLSENPKQLWVEGLHKANETVAHDCRYFSTAVLEENDLEWRVLKRALDYVHPMLEERTN